MTATGPDPAGDGPLLRVRHLTTRFSTPRGEVTALDDVGFDLARGETLGVVGESGSGKSVLSRSIMGLLPENATVAPGSEVTFRGRDVRALPPAERRRLWGTGIAMVFQDPLTSLNPVRRIGVQVTDPLRAHLGLSRAAARDRAVEVLAQVGLSEPRRRLDQYPHELSGGMRQRVGIAIAIARRPPLLIADEPTTALDVTVQRQILDLLQELQEALGMAMILVSHDLGVVAGRTKRVAVMYAGRMVEVGPTAAVFARTRHPYTHGLLASIPRFDRPSHSALDAIPGRPPDAAALPAGCRFAARCRHADEQCRAVDPVPAVDEAHRGHSYACHHPLAVGDGGGG